MGLSVLKLGVSRSKLDGSHPGKQCQLGRESQLSPKHSHFSFIVSCFCPAKDTFPSLPCIQEGPCDWISSMAVTLAEMMQKHVFPSLLLFYLDVDTQGNLGNATHWRRQSHCQPGLVVECGQGAPPSTLPPLPWGRQDTTFHWFKPERCQDSSSWCY